MAKEAEKLKHELLLWVFMSSWGFNLDSLMFQFLFNAACKICYILWMTTAFFNECFKWVNDLTPMVSNFNQQNVSCSGRWSSIWGGWSWLIVNEKPSKSSIYWMRKGVTQLCLECGNLLLKTIPSVTHGKLSRGRGLSCLQGHLSYGLMSTRESPGSWLTLFHIDLYWHIQTLS